MKLKTLTQFIEESIAVHGLKYNYSEAVYTCSRVKLTIICSWHGQFSQTPSSHINNKYGCPRCYSGARKTLTEFIQDAQVIHGTKYDYSEVVYLCNNVKLIITCPEHGPFEQTPSSHINMDAQAVDTLKREIKAQLASSSEKLIEYTELNTLIPKLNI